MLRELARMAHRERAQARDEALRTRACLILRRLLGPGLDDVEFEVTKSEPTFHPQLCELTIDGVRFKVTIQTDLRRDTSGTKQLEWEDETVIVQVFTRNGSPITVKDLADVGDALKNEPLPDLDDEPAPVVAEPLTGEHDGA